MAPPTPRVSMMRWVTRVWAYAIPAFLLSSVAAAQHPSRSERAAVVGLSASYMASALLGAHLAIRDSLPEAPFGMRSHRSVRAEFFTGTGTALSPGLPFLVVQSSVTALVSGPRKTARTASTVLAVAGVMYAVGQLSEPESWRVLRHPASKPARLLVVVGNVVLPAAMTVVGVRARRGQ